MKKRISKKGLILALFSLVFLSLLVNVTIVNALGIKLICLREGETIHFSECNPDIDDYVCDSTTCQLCANEISSGVYCPASLNACNEIGGSCEYLYEEPEPPPIDLPVITLISPVDEYSQDSETAVEIEFSFKVTKSYELEKCELIVNGDSVASKIKPISLSTQRLYYTAEQGYYIWKIKCTQRSSYGGYVIISDSRSLTINEPNEGENETSIALISPEQNFVAEAGNINFVFNVSGDLTEISQCNLNLNEQVFAISPINAENTITQSVAAGNYNWSVECLTAQETITSEPRSFTINAASTNPPAAPTGGGGGGGGGGGSSGGGGCLTTWNCTVWSSCVDGKQTRTCSKEKTYCYAPAKPSETQNCTISNPTGNQQNTENTENTETTTTTQNRLAGITGAVIGGIKNNKTPVVIVFVVIIAIAGILSYNYQKKKRE